MKPLKRFQLTYRKDGLLQRGEVEGYDLEQAVAVARKWCSLEPGRRFIAVKNIVLASPDILKDSVKRQIPEVDNFEDLPVKAAIDVKAATKSNKAKGKQCKEQILELLPHRNQLGPSLGVTARDIEAEKIGIKAVTVRKYLIALVKEGKADYVEAGSRHIKHYFRLGARK